MDVPVVIFVVAGVVISLCGVLFVVAFYFKSVKGPVKILTPLQSPCVCSLFFHNNCWFVKMVPACV